MVTIIRRNETVSLGKLVLAFWVGVGFAALGLYVVWQERNQDLVGLTDRMAALEGEAGAQSAITDLADRVAALEARMSDASQASAPSMLDDLTKRIANMETDIAALRHDRATATPETQDQENHKQAIEIPVTSASTAAIGPFEIDILRFEWFVRSRGIVKAQGQIRNVSGATMERVKVLVEWYDKDRRFVMSDTRSLTISPLMEGDSSPFSLLVLHDPRMKYARLRFQTSRGAIIPSAESIIRTSEPRG